MANRLQSLLAAAFIASGPFKTFLEELAATAGNSSSSGQQPQPLIWVAPNGSDATGQRGNINFPFATVGAALGAASTGDTILIAPGTYPRVDLGDFPPGLNEVALVGLGGPQSVIIETASGSALSWTPGPNAKVLSLEGLTLRTTDNVENAVIASGPGSGINNNSSLKVRQCVFETPLLAGLLAEELARVELDTCRGSVEVSNCNGGVCIDHFCPVGSAGFVLGINEPVPAWVAPQDFNIQGGRFQMPILTRLNGRIVCDGGVVADSVALGTSLNPAAPQGTLIFSGKAGNVDAYPSASTNEVILDGADITTLNGVSPDAADFTIRAQNAKIRIANLSSTAGGDLILDTQGGYLSVNESTFSSDCYWDRDGGGAQEVALVNGGNIIAFGSEILEPPYPPGTIVSFVASPNTLGVLATDHIAVVGSDNAGCTIQSGFVAGIDARVVWHRQQS